MIPIYQYDNMNFKEEENSDSARTESQKGISRNAEKEEYFNCKWWKHRCGFCQRIFKRKTGVLVIILIAAIGVGNLCIYQVSSKLKYQIYYLEKDLKKQKNKLETLQVEKLGKENTNTLEEDAIEKLNMIYPADSQKIYISVDD